MSWAILRRGILMVSDRATTAAPNRPSLSAILALRRLQTPGELFFRGCEELTVDQLPFSPCLSPVVSPGFPLASFFPLTPLDAAVQDFCDRSVGIASAVLGVLRPENLEPWPSYRGRFAGSSSSTISSWRRRLRSCVSELCSVLRSSARSQLLPFALSESWTTFALLSSSSIKGICWRIHRSSMLRRSASCFAST